MKFFIFFVGLVVVLGLIFWKLVNQPNNISEQNLNLGIKGLSVVELKAGEGEVAQKGDRVSVHYVGKLASDGKEFDNSYKRGTPFSFVLGSGEVIKGWEEGIVGMKVGGKRKLTIAPDLAYGERGFPQAGIPPQATLIFEVELLRVEK
mgnify:CR=1 FL=1